MLTTATLANASHLLGTLMMMGTKVSFLNLQFTLIILYVVAALLFLYASEELALPAESGLFQRIYIHSGVVFPCQRSHWLTPWETVD